MERYWKDIDYRYEVSNDGCVRNKRNNKVLRPQKIGDYLAVYIWNNKTGKQKWEYIHRLVAEAFIPNPDNLPCVNHKNEEKTDNRVENLEWCTYKYNSNYGTAKERVKKTNIKNGNWTDYSLMSDEEKEQKKRYYIPKMNHTIYVYEPVEITMYKLVAKYSTILDAANGLDVSKDTIQERLKMNYDETKLIKKHGKKYLVTRNIL